MDSAYDVNAIFAEMEYELLRSYRRNMKRHSEQEIKEGFKWEMWQAKKLKDLQQYRKEATKIIAKHNRMAKGTAAEVIEDSYTEGGNLAEAILVRVKGKIEPDVSFQKLNRRKMDALIEAINNDFDTASVAALRLVDDEYRKIVFKSQVMYGSGATTLPKAIDMAAQDFLAAGINCITYKNGAKVNIASYAEAALRTSAKKSYLTGEGMKQAEWDEPLSQITSYGACSDTCLPWQGRVYVNDVYAMGKPDGEHQLLSTAMGNGLFHPNCRHTAQPYFEGISEVPKLKKSVEEIKQTYAAEQKQRAIERSIRKHKRVSAGSVDEANKQKADAKVRYWQSQMRQHIKDNPSLSRKSYREQVKS